MPIIGFTHDKEDAEKRGVNVRPYQTVAQSSSDAEPHAITLWLYETHIGLCLKDYERNGYDDSDFYMVVWNPVERKPENICFASTRGWSYPSYGSSVDATPEVRQEYENYLFANEWAWARDQYAKRVKVVCDFRQFARDYGKHYSFPSYRLTALRSLYSMETLGRLVNLLGNSRLRSAFKLKLRQQLVDWLQDPSPKYRTPLSAKQLQYI